MLPFRCPAVIAMAMLFSITNVAAQGDAESSKYEPGRLFVKFSDVLSPGELREGRARVLRSFMEELKEAAPGVISNEWAFRADWAGLNRVLLLKVMPGEEEKVLAYLSGDSRIAYAERVPLHKLHYTPNDYQSNQWNLDKIKAKEAWDITRGKSYVTVAIVDDAISLGHEDLSSVLWTNAGEIAGNGIDDDGNGYIDDEHGYDTGMNDPDPNPPAGASSTYFFHGTHTSGIAGAATDNSTGISSIGFGISLMAVKVADDNGSLVGAYKGVEYAIAAGADVISMSWGSYVYSQTYQLLFDKAYSEGIVCIASAGNDNTNTKAYPAAYNHVLAVGSTDGDDRKSGFSNFGSWVDVMAPGSGIYSTVPGMGPKYAIYSGTSMSAPLVSGLAALIKSIDTSKTVEEITDCILHTADDISGVNPGYLGALGSGRINAWEAVKCGAYIVADFSSDKQQVCPGEYVSFRDESTNNPQSWEWYFPGGNPSTSVQQHPVVQYSFSGSYDVTLIVSNAKGRDTLTRKQYIGVGLPAATLSGNFSVLPGYPVNLRLDLTGNPPWEVTYTDGSQYYTLSNIMTSPYYFPVVVYDTTDFSLVFMKDKGCNGTVAGSARVNTIELTGCVGSTIGVYKYNFPKNKTVNDIIRTKDGGAAIVGIAKKIKGSIFGVYILKLNGNNEIIWEREYYMKNESMGREETLSLNEDNYGNLYVGTGLNNSTGPALLLKVNSSGNALWLYANGGGSNKDYLKGAIEKDNMIYGFGTINSTGFGSSDALLIKLDINGTLLKALGIGSANNDHISDLKSSSIANIMGCGNTLSFGNNIRAGWLFEIRPDLNFNWSYYYQHSSKEVTIKRMLILSDGYIGVGKTIGDNKDIMVIRFDKEAKVLWAKWTCNKKVD